MASAELIPMGGVWRSRSRGPNRPASPIAADHHGTPTATLNATTSYTLVADHLANWKVRQRHELIALNQQSYGSILNRHCETLIRVVPRVALQDLKASQAEAL